MTFPLFIVQPDTVVRRHRSGFRLYWKWKSGKPGRPKVPQEAITLIRKMSRENSTWGAPRIHREPRKLGLELSEPTVAKYRVRSLKPPSQTWKTFLRNHLADAVAIDFFTVPTAVWTGRRLIQAFP